MDCVDFAVDVEIFLEKIRQHSSIWGVPREEVSTKEKHNRDYACKDLFLDFQTKSEKSSSKSSLLDG